MQKLRCIWKDGCTKEALDMLPHTDEHATIHADSGMYKLLLHSCIKGKALEEGKQVHAHIVENAPKGEDVQVWNAIVNMYVKCGSMVDAHGTFNLLSQRDVVTWNILIGGYAQHGLAAYAVQLYWKMNSEGVKPDEVTFLSTLKACTTLGSLDEARWIHSQMIKSNVKITVHISNTLIDMYAKCGLLRDACCVFQGIPVHTVDSWNVMISAFCRHEQYDEVLKLYHQMVMASTEPNSYTLVILLGTCVALSALKWGMHVHTFMTMNVVKLNLIVTNTLIDMYSKCGSIDDARQIFNNMPERDVISWNSIMAGLITHGLNKEAIEIYQKMEEKCINPDEATFVSSLKACSNLGLSVLGKEIHDHFIKSGLHGSALVWTTLVDMYAKCGRMKDARKVFDIMPKQNVVAWNAIISAYNQNCEEGFNFFKTMEQEGMKPNEITFLNMLKACKTRDDLKYCKCIHGSIMEHGLESDLFVQTTLVDVYGRCESLEDARKIFNSMHGCNVVTWNAMIGGYVEQGKGEVALELFQKMGEQGVQPDEVAFVNSLNACASIGELGQGKQIHSCVLYCIKKPNALLGNALVDMYAKCGNLNESLKAFHNMPEHDVVSWNALISGHAQQGDGKDVLCFVEEMQREGLNLNVITLVGLLTACSHTGLVEEGCQCFDSTPQLIGRVQNEEHFGCMVDLLCRAGLLEEAVMLINEMPFAPSALNFIALLGACRAYGTMELAMFAAEHVLELEPWNARACVMLSNSHAATGIGS